MNSLDSGESIHAQINIHDSLSNFSTSQIEIRKNNKTENINKRNRFSSNLLATNNNELKK